MKPRANERQSKRAEAASHDLWCSWGRHETFRHPELKEHYAAGTICIGCQVEIMGNLEKVVFMPEISEAMRRQARVLWEARRAQSVFEGSLKEKAPDSEGLVYYIRINGQVKIGYTTNLKQRSRSYPPGSELLAVEPGTPEWERQRHVQFDRFLVRGREWFMESPELQEHMAALVEEYGRPQRLMHSYTKHKPTTLGAKQ